MAGSWYKNHTAKCLLSCKIILMRVTHIYVFNFAVKPLKKYKTAKTWAERKLRHWHEWLRTPLSGAMQWEWWQESKKQTWGKDQSAPWLWAPSSSCCRTRDRIGHHLRKVQESVFSIILKCCLGQTQCNPYVTDNLCMMKAPHQFQNAHFAGVQRTLLI